ncbi:MAG: hypothetical protein WBL48_02795 [Pseudolabrys sp.]
MDMYKVSGDVVKPGITLQNLLKYRISNGSFTGDHTGATWWAPCPRARRPAPK